MSQENVEVVRRALDATVREDWQAVVAELDPDIEIDDTDIIDADKYHGHDGFFKSFADWGESWEMEDIELVPAGEDQVVALFRMLVRGKGSGIELERQDAMLCTVRNGKVVEIGYYNDQQKALEAVGLRENVEIIRRLYSHGEEVFALVKGGRDLADHPWLGLWDRDCTLQELAEAPDAGTYHGHEGVIHFFAGFLEPWDELRVRPLNYTAGGDAVVAECEIWGRSRAGLEAKMQVFQVFTLRDNRILRAAGFLERQQALEAAGLRE